MDEHILVEASTSRVPEDTPDPEVQTIVDGAKPQATSKSAGLPPTPVGMRVGGSTSAPRWPDAPQRQVPTVPAAADDGQGPWPTFTESAPTLLRLAAERLIKPGGEALDLLAGHGIAPQLAHRAHLGYLPEPATLQPCLGDPRAIEVPAGLLVPTYDESGSLVALHVVPMCGPWGPVAGSAIAAARFVASRDLAPRSPRRPEPATDAAPGLGVTIVCGHPLLAIRLRNWQGVADVAALRPGEGGVGEGMMLIALSGDGAVATGLPLAGWRVRAQAGQTLAPADLRLLGAAITVVGGVGLR